MQLYFVYVCYLNCSVLLIYAVHCAHCCKAANCRTNSTSYSNVDMTSVLFVKSLMYIPQQRSTVLELCPLKCVHLDLFAIDRPHIYSMICSDLMMPHTR